MIRDNEKKRKELLIAPARKQNWTNATEANKPV